MNTKVGAHEIVSDLKRIASELGRVPGRDEFLSQVSYSANAYVSHFGSYTALVHACGLKTQKEQQKKPKSRDLITQKVESVISEQRQVSSVNHEYVFSMNPEKSIVFIGDAHFPFVSEDCLCGVYSFIDQHKKDIEYIVQVGDLYDLLGSSRFPRSLNYYSPDEEIKLARSGAEAFWKKINELSPESKKIQIIGNHDQRPLARVLEAAPGLETFVKKYWKELYTFESVTTNFDYRQEVIISDIVIHHGYLSQLGAHRDFNLMNSASGHSHTGGVVYRNAKIPIYNEMHEVSFVRERIIWELNAGYIGDPTTKALGYTPQKLTKWTWGLGYKDFYGPRFIPFG